LERVGGRYEKMYGYCSTGQSPQWAVVPMEEEEEEEEEEEVGFIIRTGINENTRKLMLQIRIKKFV